MATNPVTHAVGKLQENAGLAHEQKQRAAAAISMFNYVRQGLTNTVPPENIDSVAATITAGIMAHSM